MDFVVRQAGRELGVAVLAAEGLTGEKFDAGRSGGGGFLDRFKSGEFLQRPKLDGNCEPSRSRGAGRNGRGGSGLAKGKQRGGGGKKGEGFTTVHGILD